jgi:uncharacterized membrane protein YhaH (DUF805 family)
VDERRLYEVGATGAAWTTQEDSDQRARRMTRLRWLLACAVGINGATWTLAGVALVLGGRAWGAIFGTLALLTLPLLLLPVAADVAARLHARRRSRVRPPHFPRG